MHLPKMCFCGDENRTGMVLTRELVGLIDYLPKLSESVRCVVPAISAMTSSHNDEKDSVMPEQEGFESERLYSDLCIRMFTKKTLGLGYGVRTPPLK